MKIRITASQTVHYDQVVEMTEAEFSAFRNDMTSGNHAGLEGWFDLHDVNSAECIEVHDAHRS